jgi:hypothetical protein
MQELDRKRKTCWGSASQTNGLACLTNTPPLRMIAPCPLSSLGPAWVRGSCQKV